MTQPEAFVLLNIPNATLVARGSTYRGVLALECVTVSAVQTSGSNTPTRDVYLVLRIDSFETPLDPSRSIQCSISTGFRHYSFSGGNGENLTVDFPKPSEHESHLQEDFDTFDSILAQYAEFRGPQTNPASPRGFGKQEDLRGHLVLVNEDSGEIVGELDNQIVVQEDSSLNEKGREKEPVVIELPEEDDARAIFVHAIPPEDADIITKSASLIR
jgi:spartin